jgi:APA family basic amino acid/polyamine antiporter
MPQRPAGVAAPLSWPHLIALGVGAVVGTGILTLVGVGVDRAGPAVLISFGVAGLICLCAALMYAEMASLIPESGGAYTYAYAVLGEGAAWVVGWCLILEYSLVVSTVAVGWSGYAAPLLIGLGFPASLTAAPALGVSSTCPPLSLLAWWPVCCALARGKARGSMRCWCW